MPDELLLSADPQLRPLSHQNSRISLYDYMHHVYNVDDAAGHDKQKIKYPCVVSVCLRVSQPGINGNGGPVSVLGMGVNVTEK